MDRPLSVRDLRVEIRVRDRAARFVIRQLVVNSSDRSVEAANLWPVPPGLEVSRFQYLADGRPLRTDRVDGFPADVVYRRAAEFNDDPRVLAYLGRPFFRGALESIPPMGQVKMGMEFDAVLPISNSIITVHHPLDTNTFSGQPVDRTELSVVIETSDPLAFFECPTYGLQWSCSGDRAVTGSYVETQTRPDRPLVVRFGAARDQQALRKAAQEQPVPASVAGEHGTRYAQGRTLTFRDGFWTDHAWPKNPWPIRVRRFTPAYWEILWRWPALQSALASGPRLRIVVRGQPVEIGDEGTAEFTPAERARLKVRDTAPRLSPICRKKKAVSVTVTGVSHGMGLSHPVSCIRS